ncbi:RNA-guided endonuclease InsQ/TnpB family protein [Streptomyces sp. NPDC056257]|uniref:RNA-guided endonuclease InsQ/TnpB family protein n=1 Tax=Streptomyces sp. NPDC056257 TaxID=3345765 RepID=UPI0035E00522
MKLVMQVELLPTPEQASALQATLRACNEAASWVSEIAYAEKTYRNLELRRHTYTQVKARWGLGAQAAQHVIKKAADPCTSTRARQRTRELHRTASTRRRQGALKPPSFRPDAAQPYDDRMLSWQTEARTVSIWTTIGRLKGVAITASAGQLATLARRRRGESDLLHRDGNWYLLATCEVPEAEQNTDPTDFLGVDLGIVNIATTSDGEIMSGRRLNHLRQRDRALRTKLQRKGTKSAKRRAQRRRRKEARRTRDVNHKIAKHIVAEAARTGRGIGLENLTGIRERVRLRKPQRALVHSWAFAQLGDFIAYKARRAGVPVVHVDPAYTSRTCSQCGYLDRANRASQARFACRSCGFVDHADRNGSRNIRARAWELWRCGAPSPAPAVPRQRGGRTRAAHHNQWCAVTQAMSPRRQACDTTE